MNILFIHPDNFFDVIGNPGAYYMFRFLSRRHDVTIFSCPMSGKKLLRRLPPFMTFNMFSLLYVYQFIFGRYDLIYSYKPALLLPIVLKTIKSCLWVGEFRAHPVAQDPTLVKRSSFADMWAGLLYKFKGLCYKIGLRFCDLVVVSSSALRKKMAEEFGLNCSNIYVQPSVVDRKLFEPSNKKKGQAFIIAYVSSIALYRGFQTCLKASAILAKRDIPFKMLFIGRAERQEDEAKLKLLTKEIGVSDYVEWLGFIPHSKVPGILNNCWIGLSPLPDNKAFRESSPKKVLEYMSMGLGVVVSDIEPHRVMISDMENGLLFRPGDPVDLADKIQLLYEKRWLCERLGNNARKSSSSHDWDVQLGKLEARLVNLLKKV